jgi:AcrR family transcriptional regulator
MASQNIASSAINSGVERQTPVSRRELSKLETRQQIRLTAKSVFGSLGFEKATIRDIAAEAGVGLGTVMLYAQDKRDLVLLMYNDEIALARAEKTIDERLTTAENLFRFLGIFYRDYRRNILLARTYLQMSFYPDGMNTDRLYEHRKKKLAIIAGLIARGQNRNEVRFDLPAQDIAEQIVLLHRASVRAWIAADAPSLRDGLMALKKSLKYQLEGFSAH